MHLADLMIWVIRIHCQAAVAHHHNARGGLRQPLLERATLAAHAALQVCPIGASQLSPRRLLSDVASLGGIEPPRLGPTLTSPGLKVGAQPMCQDTPRPGIAVENAEQENSPLLRLPCRVKPKRLAKQAENARPPAPTFMLALRKPDREDAAAGDADLI